MDAYYKDLYNSYLYYKTYLVWLMYTYIKSTLSNINNVLRIPSVPLFIDNRYRLAAVPPNTGLHKEDPWNSFFTKRPIVNQHNKSEIVLFTKIYLLTLYTSGLLHF